MATLLETSATDHSTVTRGGTTMKAIVQEAAKHDRTYAYSPTKGDLETRNFIVEQETYPFPPLESAQKCLANFKRLMATY